MRASVFTSAAEVEPTDVQGRTAVVIDVIRATTTIVEALANGATAIYPTRSTEDALRLVGSLGREDTLLCGERKGLMIEGFDLGNSPREFDRDRVEGRGIVLSTTNGTQALAAAAGADRVLVAALLNLNAIAKALKGTSDLAIICAGKEGAFSLDDVICAGLLLERVLEADPEPATLNDAARGALALAEHLVPDRDLLADTAAGQALVEIGLEADLALCARQDVHDLVPEMQDRTIRSAKAVAF